MFPAYWSMFWYMQSNVEDVVCQYSIGMGIYTISEVFSKHIKGYLSFQFNYSGTYYSQFL